jgi:hypothetical protein
VGYDVPEVEWLYPIEGHTGGGDFITVGGTNLGPLRHLSAVTLACKIDNTHVPVKFLSNTVVECKTPSHAEVGAGGPCSPLRLISSYTAVYSCIKLSFLESRMPPCDAASVSCRALRAGVRVYGVHA